MLWKLRTKTLPLDQPVWMGIVNITPDSFSDGGSFFDTSTAVEHATAGAVMFAALPSILGFQMCLTAIQFDFLSVPSVPLTLPIVR